MKERILFRLAAVVLLAAIPLFLSAQNDRRYIIDIPDIDGDVLLADYKGQICIESFSWSIERDFDGAGGGGGGRSGEAEAGPFRLGKNFDIASPNIFLALMSGKSFEEMTLVVLIDTGMSYVLEGKYVFENVVITSYETGGTAAGELPEVFSIVAEKVTITHYSYDDTGGRVLETEASWDFDNGTGG